MIVLDYQDRRPLYEQIVEKFRHLILNGALKPGEKMPSVRQLAMDLSINPNTIQRAYMQLEQEGLVEYVRNVGCSVKNITLEDIYEIYLLRATYEILAVKLCRGVFSETAFAEMDAALESMKDLKETDYNKSIACDNMLHEAIIRSTGLPRLIKGWTDLNYGNAINYYAGNPDSRAMIDRQYPIHKELVDVCRTGNTEEICRAISNHYMKTIRRRLKEQGMPEDHFKFSIDVIDGWV